MIRGQGKWKCHFDGLRPWEGKLYGPLVWSIEAVVALPQPFALTAASNHLSPADWISSLLPSLDLIVRLFFKLNFYYQMYSDNNLLNDSFLALPCLSLCDVVVKPSKLKFAISLSNYYMDLSSCHMYFSPSTKQNKAVDQASVSSAELKQILFVENTNFVICGIVAIHNWHGKYSMPGSVLPLAAPSCLANVIIIGPESDHWLCLSLTHSLPN